MQNKTPQQIIDQAREEFMEKFGDKEGCQAGNENCGIKLPVSGNYECPTCEQWGGEEGIAKDFKRPLATLKQILSWHTSTLKAFIEAEIVRLEEMKLKIDETQWTQQVYKEWYDQAIQDQITHLKEIKL